MKIRLILAVFFFVLILSGRCFGQAGIKIGYSLADNSKVDEYLVDNNTDSVSYTHLTLPTSDLV